MRVGLSYDLLRVSSCQTILITRTAMSRTPQHNNNNNNKAPNNSNTTNPNQAIPLPQVRRLLPTDKTNTMCLHVPIKLSMAPVSPLFDVCIRIFRSASSCVFSLIYVSFPHCFTPPSALYCIVLYACFTILFHELIFFCYRSLLYTASSLFSFLSH